MHGKETTDRTPYFDSRIVDCTSGVTCISFPLLFITCMHSLFFLFIVQKK